MIPSAPPTRFENQVFEVRPPARVAPHQQAKAARQDEGAGADGAARRLAARAPGRNLHPAGLALGPGRLARPGAEVAGEPPEAGIGEQIDAVRIAVGAAPLLDDGDQLANAARAVLFGEAAHLGLDGIGGLAVDDPHRGPVDEGKQHQDRGAEQDDVEEREPERRSPD